MSRVFENVLVSEEAVDAHRFMDMIEEAVKQGKGAAALGGQAGGKGAGALKRREILHLFNHHLSTP